MIDLEVQPKLRGGTQCLRQQPRRFGGNPTLTAPHFVNTLHRHADVLGQHTLRLSERLEKLL
jgi:hypothetical protein